MNKKSNRARKTLGQPDYERRFRAGVDKLNAGDLARAEEIYRALVEDYPKEPNALANLGFAVLKLLRYEEALGIFQELERMTPNSADAKNKVGIAAIHLGDYEQAETKLRQALEIEPDNNITLMNLCASMGYLKKDQEALPYAMRAIAKDPINPLGYIQLGSHFQVLAMYGEAKEAFATAAALDPKNMLAHSNLGVIASQTGELEEAIAYYTQAIRLATAMDVERAAQSKFYMGLTLLKMGRLREGWEFYEAGFAPSLAQGRTPRRTFDQPKWNGEAVPGDKRLLIWREQGLGDELIFLTALRDVTRLAKNVVVESDGRLVRALRYTYPEITVRTERYGPAPHHRSPENDFDIQSSVGNAFGLMRPSLEAFQGAEPLIKADPGLCERYARRVNRNDGRLKVGFCWRSGTLSPTRNKHYTNIDQWGEIFGLSSDVDFFSLQYGDCDKEIQRAQEQFDVYINKWPDIDYKNDLDSLFALCSLFDVVVTVGTAVSTIAAATGAKVLLMNIPGWPGFGTDHFPSFPNIEVYPEPFDGDVANQLSRVKARLIHLAGEKKRPGGSPAF
jgi:tetratricopeptide (TPR) repeat protein